MTTLSAKSAKQNEHESVTETATETPFRLLVSVALRYAKTARDSDWDNNEWRGYWNGVIQGIIAANGEIGARKEAEYVIKKAKERIADYYSGRMRRLREYATKKV